VLKVLVEVDSDVLQTYNFLKISLLRL